MKIAPTIEGGLRIDPETPNDWHVLRAIALDATETEEDLASRLGELVSDEEVAEDWKELIVPDIRESFSDDVFYVSASVEAASAFSGKEDESASIWITREDAMQWYSALNQARLAIEEKYAFGPDPSLDPKNETPLRHDALVRNHFYGALQQCLLEYSLIL